MVEDGKRWIVSRDDTYSDEENEDDDEELDSRNCTIDDDQNESIIIHPRVVLPQSSSKKRLFNADQDSELNPSISPSKRLRFDESSIRVNSIDLRRERGDIFHL